MIELCHLLNIYKSMFVCDVSIVTLIERKLRDKIDNFEAKKKKITDHQNFHQRLCFP